MSLYVEGPYPLKQKGTGGALVIKLHAQQAARLVGPTPRHIAHGVAAAPQHQHWDPEGAQKLHAVRVALHRTTVC